MLPFWGFELVREIFLSSTAVVSQTSSGDHIIQAEKDYVVP